MKNYFFGAMLLALAACQQEVMPGGEEKVENAPVVLETTIETLPKSRLTNDALSGESVFSANDVIGLFMAESSNPVSFTFDGSDWKAGESLYWPDNETSFLFEGFYPYVVGAQRSNIPMPSLTTQDGTLDEVSKKDFLIATTSQNFGQNGIVSLVFEHQYSLMAFNLKIKTDAAETVTLQSFEVKGEKIVAPATYSFVSSSSTIQDAEDGSELVLSVGKSWGEDEEALYLLFNPVELTAGLTVTCDYTVGEEAYTATATLTDPGLQSGNLYQYQLTIKERTIEVSGCEVTDWNIQELEDIVIDAFGDSKE